MAVNIFFKYIREYTKLGMFYITHTALNITNRISFRVLSRFTYVNRLRYEHSA